MNRKLTCKAAIGLTLLLQSAGASPQSNAPGDSQAVITQVFELRADLLEFLQVAQENTIRLLRRDLDQLQQQERRIRESEAGRGQQLAQIEEQLASPDLEPEARPQVEAIRRQLSSDDADKLRTEYSGIRQREVNLTARIEAEVQRLNTLQRRADQVRKSLGR